MALVKKGQFFIAIKFEFSLVITFMAFYDCVRTLMTALKSELKDFQDTFLASCDGNLVEELWLSFHSQMMILQKKHIPSKMSMHAMDKWGSEEED